MKLFFFFEKIFLNWKRRKFSHLFIRFANEGLLISKWKFDESFFDTKKSDFNAKHQRIAFNEIELKSSRRKFSIINQRKISKTWQRSWKTVAYWLQSVAVCELKKLLKFCKISSLSQWKIDQLQEEKKLKITKGKLSFLINIWNFMWKLLCED